jgi:hypothetical protein
MDLARDGNLIEAGVWFVLALVVAIRAVFAGPARSTLVLLAVTLVAFGLSDIVESRTGAWWRPWWLFVWKAVCAGLLLFGFARCYKLMKRHRRDPASRP